MTKNSSYFFAFVFGAFGFAVIHPSGKAKENVAVGRCLGVLIDDNDDATEILQFRFSMAADNEYQVNWFFFSGSFCASGGKSRVTLGKESDARSHNNQSLRKSEYDVMLFLPQEPWSDYFSIHT